MPIESHWDHSNVSRPRERAPPVNNLDWFDGKNVKLLRMANHREAFRFTKLSQALSSMESLHKSCWLREEKRLKQDLQRLARVTPTYRSQTLFQRPSEDASPVGGASMVQLPACSPPSRSGPPTPRSVQRGSRGDLPVSLSPDPSCSSSSSSSCGGRYRAGVAPAARRPGRYPSTLSLLSQDSAAPLGGASTSLLASPSILALLPPHLSPELQGLKEAVLGFPLLHRRVRELKARACAAEQQRQAQRSVTLQPLEALRCRYLRLSESNIVTLLELCKESGTHVDFHPHMKDSDIDISKVFESSPVASASPSKEML